MFILNTKITLIAIHYTFHALAGNRINCANTNSAQGKCMQWKQKSSNEFIIWRFFFSFVFSFTRIGLFSFNYMYFWMTRTCWTALNLVRTFFMRRTFCMRVEMYSIIAHWAQRNTWIWQCDGFSSLSMSFVFHLSIEELNFKQWFF